MSIPGLPNSTPIPGSLRRSKSRSRPVHSAPSVDWHRARVAECPESASGSLPPSRSAGDAHPRPGGAMGKLDGKVALISGGARGQGEAEARLFAAQGASVIVADVLDADGKAVAESIGARALYQHLDVSDEQQWADAVATAV